MASDDTGIALEQISLDSVNAALIALREAFAAEPRMMLSGEQIAEAIERFREQTTNDLRQRFAERAG